MSICVATAALACIALPVSYYGHKSNSNDRPTILITHAYGRPNFLFSDEKKAFTFDRRIHHEFPEVKLVNSVEDILLSDSSITNLVIFGDGLTASQLKQLGNLPVTFDTGETETGLQSISWNGQLQAGDILRVHRRYLDTLETKRKPGFKGIKHHT